MDYLKDLHETCETLSRELGEANKKIERAGGKMSSGDLEYLDRLTHAIKSVKTTIAMMEAEDGGESGYYMPARMYGSPYRDSYRDGDSYRRDSMGRYSSRRSYDSGLADELHEIMERTPDESVKRDIKRAIDKIERM